MKYLKLVLLALALGFGFVLGVICNDIPNITLNPEVKIFEALTFLLTASIGILIPFFIKRWIDDSRQIKNNLIDELKDLLREVSAIREKVKFCYHNKVISQTDKQEINVLFEQADLSLQCLTTQLIEAYDSETKTIRAEISKEYMDYWKLTTGAEIMSTKFKSINENFYSRHNASYLLFETKVKQAINKVHRF